MSCHICGGVMHCPDCDGEVERVLASEGGAIEEDVINPRGLAIERRVRPATFYCCSECEWCSELPPLKETSPSTNGCGESPAADDAGEDPSSGTTGARVAPATRR